MTWSETYRADGTLAYADTMRAMTGSWMVRGAAFCTFYEKGSEGGCWSLRRTSANCYEFRAAKPQGVAKATPPVGPSWAALGWLRDKPSTCSRGVAI